MFRGLLALVAAACAAVVIAVPSASARPHMIVGFLDQASTFYDAEAAFPIAQEAARAGRPRRPLLGRDPHRGRAAQADERARTPRIPRTTGRRTTTSSRSRRSTRSRSSSRSGERRGGRTAASPARYAPKNFADLRNFAYAAAKHFSGTEVDENGVKIPAVRLWTAWNEPNQLFQLYPQYKRIQRQVRDAERDQLREDLHRGLRRRARDATRGREGRVRRHRARAGTTTRDGKRGTPTPKSFMVALKKAGLKKFDAYAHNPYSGPRETADDEAAHEGRVRRSATSTT